MDKHYSMPGGNYGSLGSPLSPPRQVAGSSPPTPTGGSPLSASVSMSAARKSRSNTGDEDSLVLLG